jgi:hypothetical protein
LLSKVRKIMSVKSVLFPPANREAAAVAFIRTFWQVVRSVSILTVAGGVIITANDLATINWVTIAYGVGAVVLSGILSGAIAAGDILTHGLPAAYTANAVATIPVAEVTVEPVPPVV